MPEFAVILPAAGSSTRFRGFEHKKPFVRLAGKPVWRWAVDAFGARADVKQVLLVLAEADRREFEERFASELSGVTLVTGGASRSESVRNALNSLSGSVDYVAVHDAARPLVSQELIDVVFAAAIRNGAAIPGLPVTSTVKKLDANDTVEATLDRSQLCLAQTPQTFAADVIQKAYSQAADRLADFTDESALVEAAGHRVTVTAGCPMNLKITTADDFQLAEVFVSRQPASRET